LYGREDGGVGFGGGFGFWSGFRGGVLLELLEQEADGAEGSVGTDFGGWGECSEGGVGGDLLDDGAGFWLVFGGGGPGEVEAGDLEAVEEESGAARVDGVGGDAVEDLAEGVLDGGAVFERG
jgi:hypothetical protein